PLLVDSALPGLLESGELTPPADEATVRALRRLMHRGQAISADRARLALQLERLQRVHLDGSLHELEGRLAEENLAWEGGLLRSRGDVHRVSGRKPLVGAGDDLARGESDPAFNLELRECPLHLQGDAASTQGIVLVSGGNAEDGHDRIADELLHRSTMELDDLLHPLEVAGKQRSQSLGICRLAQRGRADDVAEEHGHDLAL